MSDTARTEFTIGGTPEYRLILDRLDNRHTATVLAPNGITTIASVHLDAPASGTGSTLPAEQTDETASDTNDVQAATEALIAEFTTTWHTATNNADRTEAIEDLLDGWYTDWPDTAVTTPHWPIAQILVDILGPWDNADNNTRQSTDINPTEVAEGIGSPRRAGDADLAVVVDQALINLVGRMRARHCEPEGDNDAWELARRTQDLIVALDKTTKERDFARFGLSRCTDRAEQLLDERDRAERDVERLARQCARLREQLVQARAEIEKRDAWAAEVTSWHDIPADDTRDAYGRIAAFLSAKVELLAVARHQRDKAQKLAADRAATVDRAEAEATRFKTDLVNEQERLRAHLVQARAERPRVWWPGDPQPEDVTRLVTGSNRETVLLCVDGLWRDATGPVYPSNGTAWEELLADEGPLVEVLDPVLNAGVIRDPAAGTNGCTQGC